MCSRSARPVLLLLSLVLGCSTSRAVDPDIVRLAPGAPPLDKIPGPMLGPFNSYSDALLAACRKILSKPNASAGRKDLQDFKTRWRVSTEYCAWLYYTPEHKYVISKLTDQSFVDPASRAKSCVLPPDVEDPRYPPNSIRYVYALHNHPYDDTISVFDANLLVEAARNHGYAVQTKDGTIQLSVIAFFSNHAVDPSCDGFHQYMLGTNQILKWTRTPTGWKCAQTGRVIWKGDKASSVEPVTGPCVAPGVP